MHTLEKEKIKNGALLKLCESDKKTGRFSRKNDGKRHERRTCTDGRLGHVAS